MNLTKWILLAVIFGLLAYDGMVGLFHQPTESQVLRDWGHVSTCLPFVAGFLLGHWFLPRRKPYGSAWINAAVIIVVLGIWDLYWFFSGHVNMPVYRYAGWYAILGVPCGSYLWGQDDGESPLP
jgi:peptidoglycan/LPS O-acetylase OafA/YrhL